VSKLASGFSFNFLPSRRRTAREEGEEGERNKSWLVVEFVETQRNGRKAKDSMLTVHKVHRFVEKLNLLGTRISLSLSLSLSIY